MEKKKQVSYTENDEPVALVSLAERAEQEQPKQKPVAVADQRSREAKASASAPVPVTRAERQVERRLPEPKIPKQPVRRPVQKSLSEQEIYGNASIELLRKKLKQETRQRLMTDLFNY